MQAVYEQAVEQKDRVAQGRALWQLGSVLGDQGQFKNAEVPLRDALAILESELGSDHLDIAKACNGMPLLYVPLYVPSCWMLRVLSLGIHRRWQLYGNKTVVGSCAHCLLNNLTKLVCHKLQLLDPPMCAMTGNAHKIFIKAMHLVGVLDL